MKNQVHGGNIYKYDHAVLDFSANMNPLGMPSEVKNAIIENIDKYQAYPDPNNTALTYAISKYYNVSQEKIVCGNGAADIIFRIVLGLKPKKGLVLAPTFAEYEEALTSVGCHVVHYYLPKEGNFKLENNFLDSIEDDLNIVFICNPNNPTGIPIKKDLILKIARKCKSIGAVLVVDECFSDFLIDEEKYSIAADIENLDNVIILKAFTKMYAMAGIRLGYLLTGSRLISEKIENTLQPWSVSTVASVAGIEALKHKDFVYKTKEYISTNRKLLIDGLKKLGLEIVPSQANYILFKAKKNIEEALKNRNILIRDCSNYVNLCKGYYRIAVKTDEENIIFLRNLKDILED